VTSLAPRARRETEAQRRLRGGRIEEALRKEYPSAPVALQFANPLQLLVAVILSAQCTDVRVNMVTPELFRRYKTAADFAGADRNELEQEIHSTGFFRNKAKNIIACCTLLVERYQGKVPSTMEELIDLPGVGRKTANCVLSGAFSITAGIVVDTHVSRLARLLGLTDENDAGKIESDLCRILERKDWIHFGNAAILHGRRVCVARRPKCEVCVLQKLCPSAKAGG